MQFLIPSTSFHTTASIPPCVVQFWRHGRSREKRGANESLAEGRNKSHHESSSEEYAEEDDFDYAVEDAEEDAKEDSQASTEEGDGEDAIIKVEPLQTILSGDEEVTLAAQVACDADLAEEKAMQLANSAAIAALLTEEEAEDDDGDEEDENGEEEEDEGSPQAGTTAM